ncbi:MAG: Fur family transcriptional regulator [Chloroflexota bacterium]
MCAAVADPDSPLAALDRAGYRLTMPRRAVSDLIATRTGHFTAADLVDDAATRHLGIGRATVFRTLEILEAVGAIERIDLPSGDHAYIACEPADHHHHVVCSRCGRATDVGDAGLALVVGRIAAESGYRIDVHRLELFGLCPACRTGRTAARADGTSAARLT